VPHSHDTVPLITQCLLDNLSLTPMTLHRTFSTGPPGQSLPHSNDHLDCPSLIPMTFPPSPQYLLDSLYPGAPFERKHFALRLLVAVLTTWAEAAWIATPLTGPATPLTGPATPVPAPAAASGDDTASAEVSCSPPPSSFQPFCSGLLSAETVQLLLRCAYGAPKTLWSGLGFRVMVRLWSAQDQADGSHGR